MEIVIMGNKSKRRGRNGGGNGGFGGNRITKFVDQKTTMKLPEPPAIYPEWLKSVYKDLQVAVNAARRDPSLNVHDVMGLLQLSTLMCDYVYYSATHFSEISNADIDKMKDVNVIKSLVEQFKKQRDKIAESKKADAEVVGGDEGDESDKGVEGDEVKEDGATTPENTEGSEVSAGG